MKSPTHGLSHRVRFSSLDEYEDGKSARQLLTPAEVCVFLHTLAHDARIELTIGAIAVATTLVLTHSPRAARPASRCLAACEAHLTRLASRPLACLAAVFLTCIALRLALLPLIHVPPPLFHDEFSYLFAADTFSAGRLTNPLPPVPTAFETIHMNTGPTWQSMYLPGTGLALALGEKLGLPWIAVLLTTAAFCASLYWMISAWLPRRYALVAVLPAVLLIYNGNWWFDNYFCLGFTALGGALVLGAVPRVSRSRRLRDTVPLGVGLVILMLTRPYEGALFSLPLVGVLLWTLRRRPWRFVAARALLVLVMVGSAFAWLCYYNARGTGHPLLFPYMLNYLDYHITGPFLFSHLRPIPHYDVETMRRFYTQWELPQYHDEMAHPLAFFFTKIRVFYQSYLFGFGALLLLGLFTLLRRRPKGLLLAPILAFAAFGLEVVLMAWYPFPQYAAPASPVFFLLIAYGIYALRHTRLPRTRLRIPSGIALSRGVAFAELALAASIFWKIWFYAPVPLQPTDASVERTRVQNILLHQPGRQLCLVRYSPGHIPREEWVFNHPDLRHTPIVWARSLTPETDEKLIEAFPYRHVWLLQPDRDDADQLIRYPGAEQEIAHMNPSSFGRGQ